MKRFFKFYTFIFLTSFNLVKCAYGLFPFEQHNKIERIKGKNVTQLVCTNISIFISYTISNMFFFPCLSIYCVVCYLLIINTNFFVCTIHWESKRNAQWDVEKQVEFYHDLQGGCFCYNCFDSFQKSFEHPFLWILLALHVGKRQCIDVQFSTKLQNENNPICE